MTTAELIARIETYGFTCEAGPLINCVEWQQLKAASQPPAVPEQDALTKRAFIAGFSAGRVAQSRYVASEARDFPEPERAFDLFEAALRREPPAVPQPEPPKS